jgi:proteic killer suppression protein
MIKSFQCRETEKLFVTGASRRIPADILRRALGQLRDLDATAVLDDLRVPPGRRLEALSGDRAGQYSIRINQQWRVCFVWQDGNAHHVEIVDYH